MLLMAGCWGLEARCLSSYGAGPRCATAAPYRIPQNCRVTQTSPKSKTQTGFWQSSPRRPLQCRAEAGAATLSEQSKTATALLNWLEASGVATASRQAVQLGPANSSGTGLALVLTRDVEHGESLLSVPENLWINTETVSKSAIGSLVGELEPWLQVALFLIAERAAGDQSRWAAYLQVLSEAAEAPLFWTPEQRQLLQGTQLLSSLESYEQFFAAKFQELDAGLFSPHRGEFPGQVFTREAFEWAAGTVRSRVHAPLEGKNIALVPFADLIQHERGVEAVWRVDSGGLFGGGQLVRLEAGRRYSAGELVTMDFGAAKLDSQLVLDYGVLDAQNARGGFLLSLTLPESDQFHDDKADILEINGYAETWQFTLRPSQEPPRELLAFLRLVNLRGADAFMLESLFRNDAWGHMLSPFSEENERAVCQSMVDGCRDALQAYSTSIDQDLRLLRNEGQVPSGSREQMAIMVRLGEKQALDGTLAYFSDRMSKVKGLEYYHERRLKGLGLLEEDGSSTYEDFFKDGVA